MKIRVAVLGSKSFIQRIKILESKLPSIRMDYYIYNTPKEAVDIVKNIKPCHVVFFSGSLPYDYTKEARESLPIPSYYLKQDETAIATTLLSISYSNAVPLKHLSIDLIEPEHVQNVLQDIDQTKHLPYTLKIKPSLNLDEVIQFHSKLYNNGYTSLAITSIHAVYKVLQQKNIPVIRMLDPKNSIIKGLEEAKSMALLAKSQSARIAIGYIQLSEDSIIQDESFKKITNSIQANAIKEDNLYTLYTTEGDVQRALDHNTIVTWFSLFVRPIKIAFGYGKNVVEATQNAKHALSYAQENTAFIITENKDLLGPFPDKNKQIKLKTNHPELIQLAKLTTLSPANLSKIMQFSRSRSSVEFTAYDLEVYLQVSRRTTERIIKKLVDHGYVQIIGEEMVYQQGRPRSIYEFNLPAYL